METCWQDLRFALRTPGKSPGFTALAVLTLALGIGANSGVFTVVNGVVLRPMPFPEADRLFLVSLAREADPLNGNLGFQIATTSRFAIRTRRLRMLRHLRKEPRQI